MRLMRYLHLAILLSAGSVFAQDVTTVSFQNGIEGYAGTFDRRISSSAGSESNGADSAAYFLDGFSVSGNGSPDTQGLLRFDDIIGDGEGQIPAGATILEARLTLSTSLAGNAQTSGPYGVSGLLQPFDDVTSYEFDFEANLDVEPLSRGPWWQDDSATRPVAGFGFQLPGTPDTAIITPLVQSWVSGADNHGLAIQAGRNDIEADRANTSDGWSIRTTGFPAAELRPKLEVDFTTVDIMTTSFQEGIADYQGTSMAIVRSGTSAVLEDTDDLLNPELTQDSLDLGQTFLDGVFFIDTAGNTDSPDDFALLKFDSVFGLEEGQAPSDVPVAKAWAVITTGDESTNANTSGSWSAHTMLREWDTTSLHSSFGEVNGLQVDDGDIGEPLDSLDGFIRGAEVWFDVTDYLEGVRSGEEDNGIAVLTKRTADGWQIHSTGSDEGSARPRLVVYSGNLSLGEQTAGDCNGDGIADFLDLACVHTTSDPTSLRDELLDASSTLSGDLDGDGSVAFADFLILSANFGTDAVAYTDGNLDLVDGVGFSDFLILSDNFGQTAAAAASVPEPRSAILVSIGVLVIGLVRRRR